MALDREAIYARLTWTGSEERSAAIEAHVRTLEAQAATLIAQTTSLQTQLTAALGRIETLEKMPPKRRTTRATPAAITTPTTTVTDAQLQALIDRGVAAALAVNDASRSRDGDNNHGTEGVVGLYPMGREDGICFPYQQCATQSQGKYAFVSSRKDLTWWESPSIDLLTYNQQFQELALMFDRMFPEESAKVERYVGGLPDMIHGSVKASKPQSMQEAIEFATEMMDKKMLTTAERQAENKRKFKDTSRNN
ncbi:hypothetical protein Tco_0014164 [Tanacetum coccineum]